MSDRIWASASVVAVQSLLHLPLALAATCPNHGAVEAELGKNLTPGSSIDNSTANTPRWGLYGAPRPAFVINVASEIDVATTVRSKLYISSNM